MVASEFDMLDLGEPSTSHLEESGEAFVQSEKSLLHGTAFQVSCSFLFCFLIKDFKLNLANKMDGELN